MKELQCLQHAQFQRDLPVLEDYFKYCAEASKLVAGIAGALLLALYL